MRPQKCTRSPNVAKGADQVELVALAKQGEGAIEIFTPEEMRRVMETAEAALKAEKAEVEKEKQKARERTAVDEKASTELNVERAAMVKQIALPNYQQYEKVRKARKGIGVAEALDRAPQARRLHELGIRLRECLECVRLD